MDHLVLARPCWLEQLHITLIAHLSGSLVLNWSRNILGKDLAWLENFLSWPGQFYTL